MPLCLCRAPAGKAVVKIMWGPQTVFKKPLKLPARKMPGAGNFAPRRTWQDFGLTKTSPRKRVNYLLQSLTGSPRDLELPICVRQKSCLTNYHSQHARKYLWITFRRLSSGCFGFLPLTIISRTSALRRITVFSSINGLRFREKRIHFRWKPYDFPGFLRALSVFGRKKK